MHTYPDTHTNKHKHAQIHRPKPIPIGKALVLWPAGDYRADKADQKRRAIEQHVEGIANESQTIGPQSIKQLHGRERQVEAEEEENVARILVGNDSAEITLELPQNKLRALGLRAICICPVGGIRAHVQGNHGAEFYDQASSLQVCSPIAPYIVHSRCLISVLLISDEQTISNHWICPSPSPLDFFFR